MNVLIIRFLVIFLVILVFTSFMTIEFFDCNWYHKKVDNFHKTVLKMNYKNFMKVYELISDLFKVKIGSDKAVYEIEYKSDTLITFNFINFIKIKRYFKKRYKAQQQIQNKNKKKKEKIQNTEQSLERLQDMRKEIKEESIKKLKEYEKKVEEIKRGLNK